MDKFDELNAGGKGSGDKYFDLNAARNNYSSFITPCVLGEDAGFDKLATSAIVIVSQVFCQSPAWSEKLEGFLIELLNDKKNIIIYLFAR